MKRQAERSADTTVLENGKWITHPTSSENVLCFEKKLAQKKAVSAELRICGLGFFEAYWNGKRIDERYFMPAVTDYDARDITQNSALQVGNKQRTFVHCYDITDFLTGEDCLSVLVGNGYYHNVDRPEEPYVSYGDKKLCFAVRLAYEDREELIVSDESVLVKRLPMRSGLYTGDFVDFSAEEEPFVPAVCAPAVTGELQLIEGKDALADVVGEVLRPLSVIPQNGGLLYDFGVNHSGGIVCEIRGERGRKVKIKFAEVLYENGEPNYETARWTACDSEGVCTRTLDQECTYILSGGMDKIEPKFSWQCYRYAYVENAEGLEISDVRSYFIHMDVEKGSFFHCDNPLFNEIHEKARRTLLCNLRAGLLTDCPHREKRPYTGDGGIMAETTLYDLDGLPFLEKWLDDIIASQTEEGFIPYTAPYLSGGGGYAWGNVLATLPSLMYRMTGNVAYLEKSYTALVKWLHFYYTRANAHIVGAPFAQTWCLGDWLAPNITEFHIPFMSTLCYYQAADAAAFSATVLKNGDAEKWENLKKEIALAIHNSFFDAESVTYCKGIQGENVLPLAYGIVPKEYERQLKEKVRYTYEVEKDFHFDTGIVATPIVLEYLTENGMEDIAYRLMTATGFPSFADMLRGETTLSEHWSKKWPDYYTGEENVLVKGGGQLSHCHPMFGSVVAWLYKRVAGIDLSKVYEGCVRFTPRFVGRINSASANVKTPFGAVGIDWKVQEQFSAEILLPQGLQGELELQLDSPLCVETENGKSKTYYPKDGKIRAAIPSGKVCIAAL